MRHHQIRIAELDRCRHIRQLLGSFGVEDGERAEGFVLDVLQYAGHRRGDNVDMTAKDIVERGRKAAERRRASC